ncbi:MAG: T9SS type A sorting domain-containing protein [Bacteroidales bacterium]|nr:T9SS type A sorting domain-containing protein [Bacteroidales bacterium]
MKTNQIISLFLLTISILFHKTPVAQVPDNTFGNNGKVYTSFGNFSSYFHAMVLLPDGKIISVGENSNSSLAILITKHNTDGSPDLSFNSTGKKQIDFGSAYEYCNSVLLQSDNKLLLAGSSNGNAALARLLPNGDYDTDFSEDGKLTLSFGAGNGSSFHKIIQQSDGKIIAIGEAYNSANFDFAAARFNIDGSIDPSFGENGKTIINFNNYNDFGRNAIRQTDGKIIIVGAAKNSNGNSSVAMLRMMEDGALDNTFGTSGKTTMTISGIADDSAEEVLLLTNGKIVVGGYTAGDFLVMRYNTNGTLDNTFGTNGYTFTDFDNFQDKAFAMAIDNNGSLFLGGRGYEDGNGGLFHFAVAKYNSGGSLDNSFNSDGKMTVVMGSDQSSIFDMAIQTDGKLLLGGQSTNISGGLTDFALLRLENASVGMEETEAKNSIISVSPNPSTAFLNVCFTDEKLDSSIEYSIYNFYGQLIQKGVLNQQQIDVSALPLGTYLLSVTTSLKSKTVKFVKSNP